MTRDLNICVESETSEMRGHHQVRHAMRKGFRKPWNTTSAILIAFILKLRDPWLWKGPAYRIGLSKWPELVNRGCLGAATPATPGGHNPQWARLQQANYGQSRVVPSRAQAPPWCSCLRGMWGSLPRKHWRGLLKVRGFFNFRSYFL